MVVIDLESCSCASDALSNRSSKSSDEEVYLSCSDNSSIASWSSHNEVYLSDIEIGHVRLLDEDGNSIILKRSQTIGRSSNQLSFIKDSSYPKDQTPELV